MVDRPMVKYDPGHKCKISVHELEYQDGLAVRVYQPEGAGPFPALVDVHGGVWTNGDRTANEVMDRALAESGMVVAAVDFRQPPNDPYPAQVADVNLAIRWLKTRADDYNADPLTVGGIGGSSGGHTVLLSTHITEMAASLCDRIAIIDHGRLLSVGTVPELLAATSCGSLEDAFIRLVG